MPVAVVDYGLAVPEHRALTATTEVPAVTLPPCPRCGAPTNSKDIVYRKRAQAYLRRSRCRHRQCRTVVLLLPAWVSLGLGATLDQVERLVEARQSGEPWREAAAVAGLEDRPRKYRQWLERFGQVMGALLVLLPGLELGQGGGWMAKLRSVLGVTGHGVLVALRWLLYRSQVLVLGPLCLLAHGCAAARSPPSP
jgi:hypothetical protein